MSYQAQVSYTSQDSQARSGLATSGYIAAAGTAQSNYATSNYGSTTGYPAAGTYGTSSGVQGSAAERYGSTSGNYGTGATGAAGTSQSGTGGLQNVPETGYTPTTGTGVDPTGVSYNYSYTTPVTGTSYAQQYVTSYSTSYNPPNPLSASGTIQTGGAVPTTSYQPAHEETVKRSAASASGTYGVAAGALSGTYGAPAGSYSTQTTVRDPSSYTSTYTVQNTVEYQSPVKSGYVETKSSGVGQRQVQSLQVKPTEARVSVLSPYRNTMYPEFELVEDLPDRKNLIDSINILLQKSPQREGLLVSPSRVSIKRQSMLSPAEIEVTSLLKEKYEDGSIYEGEARNGLRHGKGRIIFRDGKIFEGQFVDGRAEGNGVFLYKTGKVLYQGGVANTLYEGQGALQCEAPTPLQGDFNPQDFGKLGNFWTRYEGDFRGGKKHGNGTLYLTSGEKFVGEFRDDQIHGRGTFHLRDGRAVQGNWANNVLTGTF